jgi:acyl-CoA reductase-like NAD-dependent aldehyde dehydrogenase
MKGLLRNHVGGTWVETGRVFENINPVNGAKVCEVSEANSETVDRAVKATRAAMGREWGRLSAAERASSCTKSRIASRRASMSFRQRRSLIQDTPFRMQALWIFLEEPPIFAYSRT